MEKNCVAASGFLQALHEARSKHSLSERLASFRKDGTGLWDVRCAKKAESGWCVGGEGSFKIETGASIYPWDVSNGPSLNLTSRRPLENFDGFFEATQLATFSLSWKGYGVIGQGDWIHRHDEPESG